MLLARRKEDEMKYTPLQPDEIREQVYQEAKNQFLAHGIASTEMKKLAEAVGIGRTTLYRYFPSLDRLVFMTATELWDSIFEDLMGEGYREEKNGYGNLLDFFDGMIGKLDAMPRVALFYVQFDALYLPQEYPDFPEAKEYETHLKKMERFLQGVVAKGLDDGSIRSDIDVMFRLYGVAHAVFGYEQRTALYTEEMRRPDRELMGWIVHTLLADLKKEG